MLGASMNGGIAAVAGCLPARGPGLADRVLLPRREHRGVVFFECVCDGVSLAVGQAGGGEMAGVWGTAGYREHVSPGSGGGLGRGCLPCACGSAPGSMAALRVLAVGVLRLSGRISVAVALCRAPVT
jgi:hypothetical protein